MSHNRYHRRSRGPGFAGASRAALAILGTAILKDLPAPVAPAEPAKRCACGGDIKEPATHTPGYCSTTFKMVWEE